MICNLVNFGTPSMSMVFLVYFLIANMEFHNTWYNEHGFVLSKRSTEDSISLATYLFTVVVQFKFSMQFMIVVLFFIFLVQVTEYVKERVLALRASNPGQYDNISVVRTNSMKYIPNYFRKAQLSKMFFLFPDPHFKEKNHRRRVISMQLLDEYAYVMEVGGIIYTITDVEELGIWMRSCLEKHSLFEAVPDEEIKVDPVVKLLSTATEEGQKVARNGGQTFQAIFRRISLQEE